MIPVEVTSVSTSPIAASMQVFGGSLAEILSNPITEEEDLLVESTDVTGNAGGLAVPAVNRTGLPQDIVGTLRISTPPFVEEAAYGGTPCTEDLVFAPPASVYPAIPGNKIFNCGSSIPGDPGSPNALAFTYSGSAPVTGGNPPALGRVVIIRSALGSSAQEIPDNSYYANLNFFVNVGPVTTTTAAPTTTSTAPASTTSTTAGTTTTTAAGVTTTTAAGATTTSTTAASTTTSTAPASTTSTTAAAATTTTKAAVTSTSSSSTSTTAKVVVTTATTKKPLVKTGADSRTTAAIALGLMGVGMVITGRGMQVEANGIDRRRRRR